MLGNRYNIFASLIVVISICEIRGHGMMLDPVSRSSRWRYNKTAPTNYDDNGLFCGGFGVQWFQNNGKCGLCGDDYAAPMPRPNELGGKYGEGIITKTYITSETARLGIKITTNHLGFFYFNICNLDVFKEESEECFNANKIKFSDGSYKMYIGKKSGMIYPEIILPKKIRCKHCVLRWNYQAGNNWGPCGNGTSALGCGPQENFKGCSDISITKQFTKSNKKLKKNLLKMILRKNNNLDVDEFVPRTDLHSYELSNDYLFESSNNNNYDNDFIEFDEGEDTVSKFKNILFNNFDNLLYETGIENKIYEEYSNNKILNSADDVDFKYEGLHEDTPFDEKRDSSLDGIDNVYGYEELDNNGLGDHFDYINN